MKKKLTLFFLLLLLGCKNKKTNWYLWKEADENLKKQILNENKTLFNFLNFNNEDFYEEDLEKFHLIDIDSDNDLDLVFCGWSGAESKFTEIYLNIDNKLHQKYSRFGEIKSIKKIDDNSYSFSFFLDGCCGDYEYRQITEQLNFTNNKIDSNLIDLKIGHEETPIPTKMFKDKIDFTVTKEKYYLRVTPEIDTINYFYPGDAPPTNIYQKYTTGDKGIALGEKKDKTGRVWWYVLMNENSKNKDYDSDFLPKYYGWMSSRYLDK